MVVVEAGSKAELDFGYVHTTPKFLSALFWKVLAEGKLQFSSWVLFDSVFLGLTCKINFPSSTDRPKVSPERCHALLCHPLCLPIMKSNGLMLNAPLLNHVTHPRQVLEKRHKRVNKRYNIYTW